MERYESEFLPSLVRMFLSTVEGYGEFGIHPRDEKSSTRLGVRAGEGGGGG